MPRPCSCDRVPASGPFDPAAHCPLCWHWHRTPALRAAWEGRATAFGPAAAPAPAPPPCVHLGDPIGGSDLRQCERYDCTTHPTRTACTRSDRVCAGCPGNPAAPLVVQTDGRGIGDAVSQLYACCGLADATGRPVVMKSRHALGWFAGVSHPNLLLAPHDGTGTECNPDYPGQCRAADTGAVPTRCRWYCDRLADALALPPFAPARPERVGRPAAVLEGRYAVLSPFSLHSEREWPAGRWRAVAAGLHERGLGVVAVDRPGAGDRLRAAFGGMPGWMRWHWGQPPAWTAALIANAALFVGNDSGMAHVAGLYGTPGVVVMSLFPFPFVFAEAPSLVGVGRHRQPIGDISAAEVLAAADGLLNTPADVTAVVRAKLGPRAATTEWLFGEIVRRWPSPRVVETGCVRAAEDWSAGYFTWLCGAMLEQHGGELVSVDNDPTHCHTARSLCRRWSRVKVVEADSVAYLRARTEPVDVLYLDSLDTYLPGAAEHGLAEAVAGERLVGEGGLIAFDDTPPDGRGGWEGKGRLAVPWLVGRGWRVLPASGYQTVLSRGEPPLTARES